MIRTSVKMLSFVVLLATTLALILGSAAPASAELVHRYSFNDGTANDSVGSIDGTLMNGASISDDALNLNSSTDDYLDFGGNDIGTMSSVTIEVWGTYGLSNINNTNVFSFSGENYALYGGAGLAGILRASSYSEQYVTYPGISGVPSHVAVTLDATTMKVYFNGDFVDSRTLDAVHLSDIPSTYGFLGASITAAIYGENTLNGSIDEFRIYNSARSGAEIRADYNTGPNPIPEPSAIALLTTGLLGLLAYAWRKRK